MVQLNKYLTNKLQSGITFSQFHPGQQAVIKSAPLASGEVGSEGIGQPEIAKKASRRGVFFPGRWVAAALICMFGCGLAIVCSAQAPATGHTSDIRFQSLNFAQAKEAAAAQHKLIFLDGSTSWCSPCRWMERNVFTDKAVADYFNSAFINIKIDCEKGEGVELTKHYGIKSFPTYLFIDENGTLIYRTQSRMEVAAFLTQAKRANNPDYQIPNLIKGYNSGNRDSRFLLRYIQVMQNVDMAASRTALKSLDSVADDSFLKSPEGWETIKMMARSPEDKYGKFFRANKSYFKSIADSADFQEKETQLMRYDMYQYIRNKDEAAFKKGLSYFAHINTSDYKIETAMYQAEWAGANGTAAAFKKVTDRLRKGVLKDQDEKLGFIARRFGNKGIDVYDSTKLGQCYVLAKQAVELNPDSYSNQGTFAEICISLHRKAEAVKAAEAARKLADAETSKIQGLADKLLAKAKAMP